MSILKLDKNYYAHIDRDNEKESLEEHLDLVRQTAEDLIKKNGIDLDALFNRQEILKEAFKDAIYFHDFGKINENFQAIKMKNSEFETVNNGLSSNHSFLSLYLFMGYYTDKYKNANLSKEKKNRLLTDILSLGYPIMKHHSSRLRTLKDIDNSTVGDYSQYLKLIGVEDKKISTALENLHKIVDKRALKEGESNFNLFIGVKLLYSILTASDFLGTAQFMHKYKTVDFGLIDKELRERVVENFYSDEINSRVINSRFRDFSELQEINRDNLNELRGKLFLEVQQNLRDHLSENIFYIEAPTGAGKTNLSMLSTVELLKADKRLNKVFYLFPFTRIIEQSYGEIKNKFGLKNSEIAKLHSRAEFRNRDKESDANYGKNREMSIDYLFKLYPFALLSHVAFFDALMGSNKKQNYLFHRFANSVVIIDEVQSYPVDFWDQMSYFLQNIAKTLNIRFVIMSATLPKIDKLIGNELEFTPLVKNRDNYFQNPNFRDRVEFDFSLLDSGNIDLQQLLEKVEKASKEENAQKTVIQFITKRKANEFYKLVKEREQKEFNKVLLLSGTILEFRRKEIIEIVMTSSEKILLISTQVIEAGVDIDMDLGFKNISLIDSDEQLAGRINRNSSKKRSKLYLFKTEAPSVVYGGDKRLQLSREIYNKNRGIFQTKDYSNFYQSILKKVIDDRGQYIRDINSYKRAVDSLDFERVTQDSKIINVESLELFIPIEIDKKHFSDDEVEYLKSQIEFNDKISGEKIWSLYKEFLDQKNKPFEAGKEREIFKALLSKFSISVPLFKNSDFGYKIKSFIDFEKSIGDFYYLTLYIGKGKKREEVYNIESGLNFELIQRELKSESYEIW